MGRSSSGAAAKSSTAYSTAFYTLVLVLLGFNLIVVANAQRGYYHSECGDSPVLKYKELAKSIGNFAKRFLNTLIQFFFQLFSFTMTFEYLELEETLISTK